MYLLRFLFFFFFNDTATTEIYTLSLHDALPISEGLGDVALLPAGLDALVLEDRGHTGEDGDLGVDVGERVRSEEHTSELQSRQYLVCRLLLEKKKKVVSAHTYDQMELVLSRHQH